MATKEKKDGYAVVNSDGNLPITSVIDLQEYKKGVVIRLPDFAEGQPFVVRVKRPSMLNLVKAGKIPNQLLASANELFMTGSMKDVEDKAMLGQMFDIMDIVITEAMVEPTYDELKKNGIELTDDQLIALFNYTQDGVNSLKQFRKE